MSQVLATDEVSSVVARAVASGGRVLACVCVLAAATALALRSGIYGTAVPGFVGVAALFAMSVLLTRPTWRPNHLISAIYVALGAIAIVGYLGATVDAEVGTNGYFLTLIEVAVILVGAAQERVRPAVFWVCAGLVVAECTRIVVLAVDGGAYSVDFVLLGSFFLAGCVLYASARSHRIARSMQVSLQTATREDEMSRVRRSMELQATAFMHDTVLGHLAAISAAEPGALTEHARTQISRDIALLIGRHWLAGEADALDPAVGSWEGSPVREAIADVRTDAFEVTISGDLGAVERVTIEQENALALATKQALVNVVKHAGTDSAEVVLLAARNAVTVMVIDDGVGFDPGSTPQDRLGISHSITRRIELVGGSVNIWSTPGGGTSVVMSVPVDAGVDVPVGPTPEPLP
ncbi:hypothetical protein HQQ81_07945 [Microbacteriaceae bacterium VKM Ac-2854]|nr:hypothetical protein [Microbacteriaceae bacterium VKM Ac-2854]